MFFILSKALSFLILPLNWVVGLLLFSLFSKKPPRKRKSLLAAVILILFFSNHFIFNQIVRLWEVKTITADQIEEPYDIGILLGGYSNSQILPRSDRMNFSNSANRFLNAYELYRTGRVKKLLLTGGTSAVLQERPREAVLARDFLLRIGVPEEDIILEPEARNTFENAIFSKKILDEKYPQASCLLITSAWHMRRAEACYRKAGVDSVPFSADFLTEENDWSPQGLLLPSAGCFRNWGMMIKEWIGCVAYWMKGYL